MDVSQQLEQTGRDIEKALYQISKIGNRHIVIENRMPQEINVFEGIATHCKVSLKGNKPPLIIQVKYN